MIYLSYKTSSERRILHNFDNTAAVEIETEDFTVNGDPSTSTVLVHPVLETEVALTNQSMPDEFGFISKFVEVADDVTPADKTPTTEHIVTHKNINDDVNVAESIPSTKSLPTSASSADNNDEKSPDIAVLNEQSPLLPRINDHVQFLDQNDEFVVLSRSRKGVQDNKSWFNVRNTQNGVKKCVDFSTVKWKKVINEVLFSSQDSPEVLEAKDQELQRWKHYDVFEEVEDVGQEAITTRWVVTVKTDSDQNVIKARLVARGFEEDTSHI